jgi:hypothetical protein
MDRRRFLKVTAATGASVALASCGHPENQIVRFIPEDEFVSGVATWKPSICPLCPAGCGLHVRVMDADVDVVRGGERGVMRAAVAKKLEGLAAHPVNRGALCARGQAAIQITYHPDRLRHPMKRNGPRGSGQYQEISWEEALAELASRLDALTGSNRQSALAYLSKPQQSHRSELVDLFLQRFGAPPRVRVSIFDEDVLRRANAISFGREQLPTIDLGQSRFVIGFGADFLGTWNSPVAQGAGYGAMRQGTRGVRGTFVQVESRMSQTGANADEWIPARPGTEGALALGLAHVIVRDRGTGGFAAFTPAHVESVTGVPAAQIERLARSFASAKPAVAIIGGPALAHSNGLAQALAVNALNTLGGSVGMPGGIQFTPALPGRKNAEATVAPKTLASLAAQMLGGASSPIDVVLIDDANPVFLSPGSWRVREALERQQLPRRDEHPRRSDPAGSLVPRIVDRQRARIRHDDRDRRRRRTGNASALLHARNAGRVAGGRETIKAAPVAAAAVAGFRRDAARAADRAARSRGQPRRVGCGAGTRRLVGGTVEAGNFEPGTLEPGTFEPSNSEPRTSLGAPQFRWRPGILSISPNPLRVDHVLRRVHGASALAAGDARPDDERDVEQLDRDQSANRREAAARHG